MFSKTCTNTTGMLLLAAGLAFLFFGLGYLDGKTAHLLSGVLISIAGLGLMYHGTGMCKGCNAEMNAMMKKK